MCGQVWRDQKFCTHTRLNWCVCRWVGIRWTHLDTCRRTWWDIQQASVKWMKGPGDSVWVDVGTHKDWPASRRRNPTWFQPSLLPLYYMTIDSYMCLENSKTNITNSGYPWEEWTKGIMEVGKVLSFFSVHSFVFCTNDGTSSKLLCSSAGICMTTNYLFLKTKG